MDGSYDAILVRSKLLKLLFEECSFLVRDGLLVENEDVLNIVVVDLENKLVQEAPFQADQLPNLFFQIL